MPDVAATSAAPYFDGSWIDIGSIVVALGYAVWRYSKSEPRNRFLSKATGIDFASGTAFFPLLVLCLSCLSSWLLSQLLSANRLTLSVAGIVSILSLLDD